MFCQGNAWCIWNIQFKFTKVFSVCSCSFKRWQLTVVAPLFSNFFGQFCCGWICWQSHLCAAWHWRWAARPMSQPLGGSYIKLEVQLHSSWADTWLWITQMVFVYVTVKTYFDKVILCQRKIIKKKCKLLFFVFPVPSMHRTMFS